MSEHREKPHTAEEYTLGCNGRSQLEIEHSRFYGYAFHASTREEIDEILRSLRKEFPSATHIVYAFRLGMGGKYEYFTDAGEPSGTAGAQIIRILRKRKLSDVLAAVVRYYGGTKLGTGGLSGAYATAAANAIDDAKIIPLIEYVLFYVKIPYSTVSRFLMLLDSLGGIILYKNFKEDVFVCARCPKAAIPEIRNLIDRCCHGSAILEIKE